MPNQLSREKTRVSYAENVDILNAMKAVAYDRDVTLTHIIREACAEYIKKGTGSTFMRNLSPTATAFLNEKNPKA